MKKTLESKLPEIALRISAATLSGVLLFLAFPPYDQPWLSWIALVPLHLVIWQLRPRGVFLLCWLAGFIYFAGFFNWILTATGYTLLHHVLLLTYLGTYVGVFGFIFSLISRQLGTSMAFYSAPLSWISLEYIRSNLSFMALPMGLLAHSQYKDPRIIQISEFTGVYGVSFLIILANSAVASIILFFLYRLNKTSQTINKDHFNRKTAALVSVTAILTATAFIYGHLVVSKPVTGANIKLAIVQGNIEQPKKWDLKHARTIMQTYTDLTQEASSGLPDLIIWPEAATPRSILHNRPLYLKVKQIAESTGTYILLGTSEDQKFKEKGIKKIKYFNSALLISPLKQADYQRYDKIRLFPFGEYLPAKGIIPWEYIGVPDMDKMTPGEDFTVFETPAVQFAVTICWENQFPYLVRQFVRNGAQLMINITNEAWFGKTAAPRHFVASSVFRAVENRVYVVRCANTGISCFIDPYGRIINRVKDAEGRDIFVRGVSAESIIPMEGKTIYSRYGNILVWLCFIAVAGILVIAFVRGKRSI